MTSATFPVVVVSNRLPVTFSVDEDGTKVPTLSPGGLVAAVAPSLQGRDAAWVGWDGTNSGDSEPSEAEGIALFPVSLSQDLVERHYEGFSNATLWPLFHDVGIEPEIHESWWEAYEEVNSVFAHRAAEVVAPGGIVWVHDYQMMLVPSRVRALRPDVRIGYFHHIPFCSRETLEALPEWRDIVAGLGQSDIAGFQRVEDSENFRDALQSVPSSPAQAMTYPISIDFDTVSRSASEPPVVERATQLRAEWGNPDTVFLGVDRIDYTKGIPERLEAFEYLLDTRRVSSDETLMFQAGSPSRENVAAYQDLRERVEEDVRRINLKYLTESGRDAVLYRAENLEWTEMLALFVAADVMVVSSLRDGMNLVAKEFVACRNDDSGVLVLSPFTGAADQMEDAILADPRDRETLAGAMLAAATMTSDEQNKRMRALRQEVREHEVAWWANQILGDLGSLGLHP